MKPVLTPEKERAQERAAAVALYPRSGHVIAAPVNPPKGSSDVDRRRSASAAGTRLK
jgi:hypothetical protein